MELIWYGTASLELINDKKSILIDPFVPLYGSRVDIKLSDFSGNKNILVTHGHFDHIYSIPDILKENRDSKVYLNPVSYDNLVNHFVDSNKLNIINVGDEFNLDGFDIKVYNSKHAELKHAWFIVGYTWLKSKYKCNTPLVKRLMDEYVLKDEVFAYDIKCNGKNVFVLGSLNICKDVDYPENIDYLVLPYNGWTFNFPAAKKVIEKLKPKKILVDHYDDTFPPLTPKVCLKKLLNHYGDKTIVLDYKTKYKL